MRVVLEVDSSLLAEQASVAEEEAVRVEEGEENAGDDVLDSLLLEAETVAAHDGRVDEEEAESVGAELVDDKVRIGVVLETLGHLLAVADRASSISSISRAASDLKRTWRGRDRRRSNSSKAPSGRGGSR